VLVYVAEHAHCPRRLVLLLVGPFDRYGGICRVLFVTEVERFAAALSLCLRNMYCLSHEI
jgi:hypothetical protein